MDSKGPKIKLPGFRLPVDFIPQAPKNTSKDLSTNEQGLSTGVAYKGIFPTALDSGEEHYLSLTTLREIQMLGVMNSITDKPKWHQKVFDESISFKWREEAMRLGDFSFDMAKYVIEEVRYKAKIFQRTGMIDVFDVGVVKSDSAVSEELKSSLRNAVESLEVASEADRDWHPGSDGKVLDLVHPSLYPVVYGKSRILPDRLIDLADPVSHCGTGEILEAPQDLANQLYSQKFQWMPCEVALGDGDGDARIISYINNLDPIRHKDLYSSIQSLIICAIPLWNRTLSCLVNRRVSEALRIRYAEVNGEAEKDLVPPDKRPKQQEDESEDDFMERESEWWLSVRDEYIIRPEPSLFSEEKETRYSVDLARDYGNQGLQVIVKLANIHLTPEKPQYDGGTWHVEGQLNEHIIATAIYYYDSHNITESRLSFRQSSNVEDSIDIYYDQDDHAWLPIIFGCENDGLGLQELGSILCQEDRLISFPNILQHRVEPFKLESQSPGHRKIIALFLVDPNIKIISSANVPPQRRDWWGDRLWSQQALGPLPPEIYTQVVNSVNEFPISVSDAKKIREELMDERSIKADVQNDNFAGWEAFALCEH